MTTTAIALPPLRDVAAGVAHLVGSAGPVAAEAARLAGDLARVAAGTSEIAPEARDRRFADAAWNDHPGYRRLGQSYLALTATLDRLVTRVDSSGADWRTLERARLARAVIGSALAPTNTLLGNPDALKRAFETGGVSLLRGLRNALTDLRRNGGMPSQVDRSAFTVGEDVAISPGSVVQRDDVAEVIQYTPTTAKVRKRPLVVVPPPIGRYYFLDLGPGRSFVEYAVSQGHQVFMVSWRNPGPEQSDWGVDTYAGRIVSALDAVSEITGSEDVDLMAFCAGGILSMTALNHLHHIGQGDRVHSMALAVTLLDFDVPAPIGAFASPAALAFAARKSQAEGVITARSLGSVFSWMRPDDLVWGYVVNGWLKGEDPPAFDILAWNADGTNLPARLHGEFLDAFGDNKIAKPGALTVLGSPVDLSRITTPMFVTGARTDHLTPWRGTYRTTQLVGGDCTYALSNSGHVASLVNPPGNPKAHYKVATAGGDADKWEETAVEHTGSWWEGWVDWVAERSESPQRAAPKTLGSRTHRPLDAAPGRYVQDVAP